MTEELLYLSGKQQFDVEDNLEEIELVIAIAIGNEVKRSYIFPCGFFSPLGAVRSYVSPLREAMAHGVLQILTAFLGGWGCFFLFCL